MADARCQKSTPVHRNNKNDLVALTPYRRCIVFLLTLCVGSALASDPSDDPSEVSIGLRVEQITGIDQKDENFRVVAALRVDWHHDRLAYQPGQTESAPRAHTLASFISLIESKEIRWPALTLANAQGKVDYQTQIVQIHADGTINYFERFTATFQAPDFDFRRFPFDHQRFSIIIDSVFSNKDFLLRELPGYSGIGSTLGEEEWAVTKVETHVTTESESGFEPGSRFSLEFHAIRHLDYYVIRILIPITLIIVVSWFTFFLRDYRKRIDLSGANLLLFIAFNFTVANDLPRLGYVTLIDAVMVGTFTITSIVILVNVVLRRLETSGRDALARRLDAFAIAGYPVSYIAGAAFLATWFK